jgi:Ni,Fe-hydrogenase III large subunit/Ni,Fe-hydrogenase III component G
MDAPARTLVSTLRGRFAGALLRVDQPADDRLLLHVAPGALRALCAHLFEACGARYITSTGADDRPFSGTFLVAHDFALDADGVLLAVLTALPGDAPRVDSITPAVPGAAWAERELFDLVGIEPVGHPAPGRLVLPDGWPDGVHPLRRDQPWDAAPASLGPAPEPAPPPEGCMVVPLGPYHPALDEPAHFRLFVDGERIRGCVYRGFMAHRGIEKLAESALGYEDVPVLAERICGICGCVHSVAYVQAVESAAGVRPPPRAELIRTVLLELERLHSHLLWVGLACHLAGFDTLFMHCFRLREPLMWLAERITGNRKTYGLCVVGGVRWDLPAERVAELRSALDTLEAAWAEVTRSVARDLNLAARLRGVGVVPAQAVRALGLVGPVARAAGVELDCRSDHPYAAYRRLTFEVVTAEGGDAWARLSVRAREVPQSVHLLRQALDRLEPGPLRAEVAAPPPAGLIALSSVEAPRGEAHHLVVTGDENRPRRWKVRAPTYQNLQAVPAMLTGQTLADVPLALGSLDPCFSCTDRLETVDVRTGGLLRLDAAALRALVRAGRKP